MAVGFSNTNKPLNPRGNDASPKGYNRASLFSGKALDFDGVNDSVSVAALYIATTTNLSFSCYFKTTQSSQSYIYENDSFYVSFYRDNATTPGELSIFISSGVWLDTGLILNDGHWYHLVVSLLDGTPKVYLNGQLSYTGETRTYNNSGSSQSIGMRNNSTFLDGQLTNFKIFNVGLTAAQVADLYNNPEKVVPTGVDNTALKLFLPMQEGAGTTAYDGSGNGNHGTISGATYVHGIGAPVSQTAVIDWNKGTNLLTRSEEFLDSDWIAQSSVTLTSGQDAPDGSTNAFKYNLSAAVNRAIDQTYSFGIASYTFAIYVKAIVDTTIRVRSYDGWSEDISINVADGWTRVDSSHATSASSAANIGFFDASGSTGDRFYIWGASLEQSATAGPYVRTGATAQTSPVLLPQGLTTGRDITGVNLFENVRKQGALNLDGNSWAEVHDNESLDFGTGDLTIECWSKATYENTGSGVNVLMSLGGDLTNGNTSAIVTTSTSFSFYLGGSSTLISGYVTGQWYHIVGVRNGSSIYIYINGSLENSKTQSGTITNEHAKQIGRDSTTDRSYKDQIAQPRIYNRALTAAEVLQNYNSGKNTYTNN